jgi:hypothetical protein
LTAAAEAGEDPMVDSEPLSAPDSGDG